MRWDRSRIQQRFRSFGEQRSGFLFPARRMRLFVSPSCSREDVQLASSAQGSCSQRVDETVCLSVLFSRRR